MRIPLATTTFVVALAVSAEVPLAASSATGCSNDAFVVRGTPLAVELCAPPATPRLAGKAPPVVVVETLTAKGQAPMVRRVTLDAALGDETNHTIDDAPLQSIGIAGTLHMTLAYKNGAVHLEHALLVPGAIALK